MRIQARNVCGIPVEAPFFLFPSLAPNLSPRGEVLAVISIMVKKKRKADTSDAPGLIKKIKTTLSASNRDAASGDGKPWTRSQKANDQKDAICDEGPPDPNNPDGDDGGGGDPGSTGGGGPPAIGLAGAMPNRDVLANIASWLDPSDSYLCQRVCSLWRDQFSNLFVVRRCLEGHFSETQPMLITAIRQRRELALRSFAIGEVLQYLKPPARVISLLEALSLRISIRSELLDGRIAIRRRLLDCQEHPDPTVAALATSILDMWMAEIGGQDIRRSAALGRFLRRQRTLCVRRGCEDQSKVSHWIM